MNALSSDIRGTNYKVLHLLKLFRPSFTGAGIFLERLTPVMDALAPNVAHDLLVTDTPRPAESVQSNSALRNIIYLQKGGISNWRREFLLLWWLLRNIQQYRVIHFHTHVDRYFLSYLLAKLFRKRVILSSALDDSVPNVIGTYRRAYRPLVRLLVRLVDLFMTISPKLYAETAAVVGPKKVHLVPIGVAVPAYPATERNATRAALGLTAEDIVLIFVGGICSRKDPLFLVERMPAVRGFCPHAKLVIVGPVLEADHQQKMLAYIRDHGLEDHVIFTGNVLDPYPLYAMADIMVFASHLEGFGCAVTEGMAHCLPAVARHLPGVNDFFVHQGKTGFLFRTPEDYLGALRLLIDDPVRRRQIGLAARHLILSEFDDAKAAKRILSIYGFNQNA